jgi:hypothetical protein
LTSNPNLSTVPEAFSAVSNQSKWMRAMLIGGTAAWLASAALPCTCEFVIIFEHFHTQKHDFLPSSGPIWTVPRQ